ncbi:MAG: hypothetical protein JXN64_08105 [Spirochaetes bacterium]|nr:hypothetical protein [Spirochaetota bacterium]
MQKYICSIKLFWIFLITIFLAGCGTLTYTITEPEPSGFRYAKKNNFPVTMYIIDKRTGNEAVFLRGKLGVGSSMSDISNRLKLENMEDPVGYLAARLEKEFALRGIAVRCIAGQRKGNGLSLYVNRYQIISYRTTGFSPWEACHVFDGTLIAGVKKVKLKAYIYNGKAPVWSMNEIMEPCFNIPVAILIKDIASKINRAHFQHKASDQQVEKLARELNAELVKNDHSPFWKVLELGYTNNVKAIAPLKKYSKKGDEFFSSCCLSAIGIIGQKGQLEFLKGRFKAGSYNDRYMSVKAIGDLETKEGLQYIKRIKKTEAYKNEGGLKSVVDLYAR